MFFPIVVITAIIGIAALALFIWRGKRRKRIERARRAERQKAAQEAGLKKLQALLWGWSGDTIPLEQLITEWDELRNFRKYGDDAFKSLCDEAEYAVRVEREYRRVMPGIRERAATFRHASGGFDEYRSAALDLLSVLHQIGYKENTQRITDEIGISRDQVANRFGRPPQRTLREAFASSRE